MDGITTAIFSSVGSAVAVAVITWLWLRFTERGRTLWTNFGKVEGLRSVAVVAALAFVLGLVAAGAFFFTPHKITVAGAEAAPIPKFSVQRFGAKGRAGAMPGDEGFYYSNNNDTLIAARTEFPICFISSVSTENGSGACQMYQSPNDDWRMYVSGGIGCKVTCLHVKP